MTDAALVLRARGRDELAFRRLLDRHQDLIGIHVSKYFAPGADRDDLVQEAQHGFFKAVRDYKAGQGSGFRNFASLCVERQVVTAVMTATRRKHEPLNAACSYDAPISPGAEEDLTLADLLADPRALEPAEQLAQGEQLLALTAAIDQLTPLEHKALIGVALEGESYEALAAAAGVSEKTIDNALQRSRRKLVRLVGVGADGVEAQAARPLHPQPNTGGPLPPRPRQRRLGRAGSVPRPTHPTGGGTHMSIVDSIDAERSSVKEEIDALEAQLGSRREQLDGLEQLREQAVELTARKAEGGGACLRRHHHQRRTDRQLRPARLPVAQPRPRRSGSGRS